MSLSPNLDHIFRPSGQSGQSPVNTFILAWQTSRYCDHEHWIEYEEHKSLTLALNSHAAQLWYIWRDPKNLYLLYLHLICIRYVCVLAFTIWLGAFTQNEEGSDHLSWWVLMSLIIKSLPLRHVWIIPQLYLGEKILSNFILQEASWLRSPWDGPITTHLRKRTGQMPGCIARLLSLTWWWSKARRRMIT